jgi:predicted nucleic acid-binding protein
MGVYADSSFLVSCYIVAAANLDADLRAGRLVRTILEWPVVFRLALRLSGQHAVLTGTRSLDILHVAAAKALRLKELASFDGRQRALGAAATNAV